MAFQRGTFRVRGEVIDIYPAESDKLALRVELFDEEVERLSVRSADRRHRADGGALHHLPQDPLRHPARDYFGAIEHIKEELKSRREQLLSLGKLVEEQRISQRTQFDIEMMQELGYCSGIENYSRYLSGRAPGEPPPTLFDYLPGDGLLIIDESHVTVPQIGAMFKGTDPARRLWWSTASGSLGAR